jgi:hypothetical protein
MNGLLRRCSVAQFNARWPVGCQFRYYLVPGIPDSVMVTTRSAAWDLPNGRVVVSIEGRVGFVSVSHLEPINTENEEVSNDAKR